MTISASEDGHEVGVSFNRSPFLFETASQLLKFHFLKLDNNPL